jgi:DNA-directed RNA polymerase alpha subunit
MGETKKFEMPTIEECQATEIKRLQGVIADLNKKYDGLLEKYQREVLKISKPPLSSETVDLLCGRICDTALSARIIHATDAREIIYLFQLISLSKEHLMRIRHIYKKSAKEIENFVSGLGLILGTNFSQEELNYFWEKIEKK